MSIVRVGTTKKYADGWESIFGKKSSTKSAKAKKAGKSAKKPTGKKKK